MRVKKLLPLILLAVGAVFLLSSCDAILDAIYANNTVNVTVDVSSSNIGYANTKSYVWVGLSGASTATQTVGASTINIGLDSLFYPTFNKQPNGNYTITVYYYGYAGGGTYVQYGPETYSFSFPNNGTNFIDVTFPF